MKKEIIKRSACTVAAAFIAVAAMSFPSAMKDGKSASAADTVLKYEFEDGKTSGGKFYTSGVKSKPDAEVKWEISEFSGSGFAYLDQKGTTISVDVEVPADGLYELTICYCEPTDLNKKVQYLNVNGVNQGEVSFPFNTKFEETSGGVVNLKKGKNTIELKAYWGYAYYDYLTLKPASEKLTKLSPDRTLSNQNASDSAKRLYSYLCDTYGNHIIAGQQEYCGEHNYNINADPTTKNYIVDNEAEFQYIEKTTGKQPAIRGIDLLAYNSTSTWRDHAPERAIQWVNEYKGIATLTWHWNVPLEKGSEETAFYVKSAAATYTTFSISKALEEGTWEHEVLLADIDVLATELKKLKEADVPVLWRPLHEAEGGWFWWGAEGPEPCKELYRLLYDKLTNEYGLDNLIWVWTGYTFPTSAAWYPGNDVVDIVGYDKYNAADGMPNLSSISSTFYSLVQSTDCHKMVTMSENDSIPSVENLVNDKAAWLYFCPWYMNFLTSEQNNPVDNLKEIYNSDYCITLDELPDLKKYPINEGDAPSKTTTAVTTTAVTTTSTTSQLPSDSDYMKGDVNCDGTVELADAILIMQSLANPNKYGTDGSDEQHITEKGQRNGDVDKGVVGITANDALEIQRYLLKLTKWD
ncbi:glycosyl hydrolase [Ruminococcus flavefaciens]|uniref:glycosyl hydrolase n=1 Tax=Ruminococcus flavefaciens TaxID=1265 RepID=UPI0026ED1BCF|nr:glycosyl hydrolase [Ruminococcus flavefaciens]